MNSMVIIWRWLALFSVLIFPQLLGVLLYLRLSRLPGWLARGLAILAPAVVFFFLSRLILLAGLREVKGGCGMPSLAVAFMILAGTVLQLCVAPVVHLLLLRKPRN